MGRRGGRRSGGGGGGGARSTRWRGKSSGWEASWEELQLVTYGMEGGNEGDLEEEDGVDGEEEELTRGVVFQDPLSVFVRKGEYR